MRIGTIPTIKKWFSIHTRELERRINLGLEQVVYFWLGIGVDVVGGILVGREMNWWVNMG